MPTKHAPRPFARQLRVANELHREIASWLFTHLDAPTSLDVTVTRVDLSKDYKWATIYFLVREGQEVDVTQELLNDNAHPLQKYIGERLHMKRTPRVRFVYDSQYAHSADIGKLLKNVGAGESSAEDSEENL